MGKEVGLYRRVVPISGVVLSTFYAVRGHNIVKVATRQRWPLGGVDCGSITHNVLFVAVSDGFICHSECQSNSSCWGRMDHQCVSCLNFAYLNRCVSNCSSLSMELPSDDPGVFSDESSLVCEPCDPQCIGGCSEGTVRVWSNLSALYIVVA